MRNKHHVQRSAQRSAPNRAQRMQAGAPASMPLINRDRGAAQRIAAPSAPMRQRRNPRTGQWLKLQPGEVAASETAGLRSAAALRDELPTGLEFLRAEIDAFISGALADEGDDAADIPTRRRAQLEYRARLHRRIVQLDTKLELLGLTDRHNKLRVAWLGKLESMISTAVRIDGLLGLDRRAKHVETPAEWVARISAAQTEESPDTSAHVHTVICADPQTEQPDDLQEREQ